MTKFIKAVKGNVSAAGRLFSEGVVSTVTDEVGTSAEITQMEKLGYLKVFNSQADAVAHAFTGIAAQARNHVVPVSSAIVQANALKAAQAKALAEADAKAVAEAKAEAAAAQAKLTAAAAKAAADAATSSVAAASPVTTPTPEASAPVPAAPTTPAS
jgi:hypothetical protein